jgi:hypothetical protein
MTLRMKSQLLNLQPQQVKFYISLHLLFNLVSSLIFNSFQMITSQPLKFFMQVLFAKVRSNTFINIRFISSKLPIISVEAGGEESWISDDSCDDVNNNQFCNFDGGDCCGANVIKQYCIDCDCLGNLKKVCFLFVQFYGTTSCI